jgi:hypothetical protein
METREWIEGWLSWDMQSFRWFQIIQGVSSTTEVRPLRSCLGVCCLACNHQSMRESSQFGALAIIFSHASTSCQAVLVKGHLSIRWRIVSGAWLQRGHRVWCCRPCLARRSTVTCPHLLASERILLAVVPMFSRLTSRSGTWWIHGRLPGMQNGQSRYHHLSSSKVVEDVALDCKPELQVLPNLIDANDALNVPSPAVAV